MSANRNYSRIDTLELKALIFRKVGHHRAEKYFFQLRRLLNLKISKSEFDKFCIQTIGRENIRLHNQLIRSIVKNASLAKVPHLKGFVKVESALNIKITNERGRNDLETMYGDGFPPSPHKGRSTVSQDSKYEDHPSPLEPLGKPQSVAFEESISKTQEQSATELHSLGSRPPVEVALVEEGEEVEQLTGSPSVQNKSPVTAPLGISMKLGCVCKTLSNVPIRGKYHTETCQGTGELPDTRSLRSRLEQTLETEGLGIAVDCVNLLNNGLDAYLKRLLEFFMGFAGSRRGTKHLKQINGQLIPGLNVLPPGRYMQAGIQSACASLLDFRVAMELSPQVLGEDWPILLEKICFHASQE
ncbi:Transcriptional coactivator Hfi1/Transcriptional adapter 1 [Quillaja saponaria]|uniref:Transcriptional coactivator Hfi1/Transcriptional adapter 1 n=1 Tax=Quillaja saponaria TaxID=32244 RepID=A0AAD7KUP0_QUISA|nr:Transcriptional coactivator Hfi1/Transcriptional adapter 1 [Quillaja saponaria]